MPLTIVNHPEGGDRPTIICDECGKPIEKASEGNYQWVMSSPSPTGVGVPAQMYFTHKQCCHSFELRRPLPKDSTWGAIGLDWLPVFLINNLGINLKKTRESIRLFNNL